MIKKLGLTGSVRLTRSGDGALERFLAREQSSAQTAATNRLAEALERSSTQTIVESPKVAAAKRALAAVREKGFTPSARNVALMSEKLGQKVTRATIANYLKKGLIEF